MPARVGRWLLAACFGGLLGLAIGVAAADAADPPAVTIDDGGSHRYFSPNGDGQNDELSIYYCLAAPANVTVTVEDSAGQRIRTVESGVSHQGGSPCFGWNTAATWDGRADDGAVAADGVYTVRAHAVDGAGLAGDDSVQVGVDTRIPGAITAPQPGAAVAGTLAWTFTPTAGFAVQAVNVYCDGTDLGWSGTPNPDGTLTGSGDATGCIAGANTVTASVSWTDPFGTPQWWTTPAVPVSVVNALRLSIDQADSHQYFTPDGDGQQDTALVYYCLSRSGPVTMTVTNAAGAVVRTSTLDGLGGPECYGWNSVAEWDGHDDGGVLVADGVYTVHLRTTDPDGQASEDSVQVGVDQHGAGALTAPAEGATISGTVDWVFTPAPGHTVESVEVACDGASLGTSSDLTGSGDTTGCIGGPNNLVAYVTWTDPFGAGHYWSTPPVHVTVDNPPQLSIWQEVSHRYFSPNGDGQDDELAIYYCLSKPATVTATVTDGTGAAIRTIAGPPFTPGQRCEPANTSLSWDGRTDAGVAAAPGTYTVRLHAVDGAGRSVDDSVAVGIDTRQPGTLTEPAGQSVVEGPVAWVFTPANGVTVTEVDMHCEGPALAEVERPSGDGTFRGIIDTTGCVDGPNELRPIVFWRDPFGAFQFWFAPVVPVTVDNAPRVQIDDVRSHRYFNPNGDGNEDTVTVRYCLSADATARVTVADETGTVRRTIDSTAAGYPSCFGYNNTLDWDGRDDAGTVVPDGVYTVRVAVTTAGGRTAEDTVEVGVDNRVPGGVLAPTPGAVLAGLATPAFQPAPGFTPTRVYFAFSTGGGDTVFNASPDGVWRTTIYTGGLRSGPARMLTGVSYRDAFGADHWWYPPEIPVVIDATSVPLAVTADPTTGTAPLATTLRITASEPQGRTLQYQVDFGDGSPAATGELAAPYAPLTVAHTYRVGVFRAIVTVTSPSGAAAARTVDITATGTTNTAPSATLTVDRTRGVAPLTAQFSTDASDREGDPLTYLLEFGDGTSGAQGSLPHAPIAHTYTRSGTFVARLTVSDGRLSTIRTTTVVVAITEPLVADAGDDVAAVVNAPVHFDGGGSRPSLGIESYQWSFGDGGTASGSVADHTYTHEGTYTATLTARSGNQTNTDTAVVTVKPEPTEPGLVVTVTAGGSPLPDATVMYIDADGLRTNETTGDDGKAHLAGLPDGSYTVYGWKSGYLPATGIGTVTDGSGELTLELSAGQVAETSLTSEPLTRDEIIAAGIDPDDPDNQQVHEFTVNLAINDEQVEVTGYASPGGFPVCPDVNGTGTSCDRSATSFTTGPYTVSASVTYVHKVPQLVWLVMPTKASWLKEFFSVQLAVTNLADPGFTLDEGVATLTLPAGLSLAPTVIPQHTTVPVPDISGGHSATASWLVRGDVEGSYDLSATYAAVLAPFGEPVTIDAATANPLHVWGGSAVSIIVDAEQDVYNAYPYRVRVGLKNVADVPIYNAAVQLADQHTAHYLRQPGQTLRQETAKIEPGATFWTDDFIFAPDIDGELELDKTFVTLATGTHGPTAIVVRHPSLSDPDHGPMLDAVGLGNGVGLIWSPIAGATSYEIYQTPNLDTEFPDTPVATVSAGRTKAVVPLPHGGSGWFAVSAIINGKRTMVHPIVDAGTSEHVTAPRTEAKVSSTASCDQDITVTAHFTDTFFELTGWTATLDGVATPVGQGALSGSEADATFTIKAADLKTDGIRLHITATDNAPAVGPEWTTEVSSGCNPIRLVVVGDSIAWGQGLQPDHKYPELVKDALHEQTGRPVEYTKNVAHSGAEVDPHRGCTPDMRGAGSYYHGEIPVPTPDIGGCQVRAVHDQEADVILVSGCINDVNVLNIMFNPLADLHQLVADKCGQPVAAMLLALHADHPTATIVYTGYYPIIDRALSPEEFVILAGTLGLSRAELLALGAEAVKNRSVTFDAEFRNTALQHVATLDPAHTWLRFADPGFQQGDGLFDANAKLFHGVDDEVRSDRIAACIATNQFFPCPIASLGHPNQAGARKYADAIMGNLSNYSPRITGLTASPVTLAKGTTAQLAVTATYSDGSTRDAAALVTATSKNPKVATVNPTTLEVGGVIKGKTKVVLTLSADPTITTTVPVTVTAPDVVAVTLDPPTPIVQNGKTVHLSAVLTLTDGTTKTANGKVIWASSNPATATVTDRGLVRGVATGTVTITATYQEDPESAPVTGSTLVTVSAGKPVITGFSPGAGPVGSQVTVEGTDLLGVTSVTIGGVAVTEFTVNSSSSITITVPPRAKSGVIAVTTPLGTAKSATRYTVT